jgi:hypothetical protein
MEGEMNTSARGAGQAKRETLWHARLARHATSGLSVAALCEHESVSTANFYLWRALLSGQTKAPAAVGASAPFIDVGAMRAQEIDGAAGVGIGFADQTGVIEVSLDPGLGLLLRTVPH